MDNIPQPMILLNLIGEKEITNVKGSGMLA